MPAPDELDLAAQASPGSEGSHEIERLLSGRIFTIGNSGTVSAWTERAQRAFGFTNAGVVGESFVEKLLAPAEREKRAGEIAALLGNDGPPVAVHIEARAVNADGREFEERFAVVPIRLHDGYELNSLLQDLAKYRREDDRPRLRKTHASVLSVIEAELTGRVEPPTDGGEETERLVGALVIFDGADAPVVSVVRADGEDAEEDPEAPQREIEELRERLDRLQCEAEEARHDAELAREEVEQTRSKLSDLRGAADDEHGRAEQLGSEMAELRAASEQAEAQLEEARARAEQAQADLDATRGDLDVLKSEHESLRAELDSAHESGDEQTEALRRELEEARSAQEEAVAKLAEMEGELSELTEKETELTETVREREELVRERDELAQDLEAKQAELAAVQESGSEEMDALRRELDDARAAQDEAAAKITAMEGELSGLTSKRDELASELDAKRSELSDVAARRDELAGKLDSTGADLADLAAKRGELAAELEAKRAELAEVAGRNDELAAELGSKEKELAEAAQTRDELAAAVEAKEHELEDAEALRSELEEARTEHERLAEELARRERELAEAGTAAEEARGDADRRQARVDELAEAVQDLRKQLEDAPKEFEETRKQLESAAEEARLQAKGAIGELDEARHQVELFRGAFDTAPIGMALTAPDGRFVKVNSTLCRELGYSADQLLSDDPPSIVHPDDMAANREMARRLLAGEITSSRAERRYVHADGHEIHMRESVALVRDGDETPLLFIFQLEDATEQIELGAPDESHALGSASGNLPVPLGAEPAAVEGPFLSPERVRQALEDDQFVLYCQPVLDLRTNEISQYELLIRMVDEDGRLILPQAFLKPAEQSGLIKSIDHWVVRRAIRLIGENRQAGRDVRIEVNVSPESLVDRDIIGVIDQELAATPIDPSNLVVEVTESAAAANPDGASALARGVRGLGARFALDDFGSTFGSFRHLKDLPLDYLKIDGDLVGSLTESRTSQLVVKALVDVARGTGTETIAVFVSDDETLMLLRQHGVGFAQGYVVGRPQPLGEVFADGRAALPPAG